MPRYVAFLRAINVGGRTVRMDQLRQVFTASGLASVETFIASGNVIFESRAANVAALEEKLEHALQKRLGYPVTTFVRLAEDLDAIVRHQPFAVGAAGTRGTIHVGFLREPVPAAVRAKIRALKTEVDEFDAKGREFYWLIRGKFLDSQFSGVGLEKLLGGPTTLRNRNTIVRLAKKYGPAI